MEKIYSNFQNKIMNKHNNRIKNYNHLNCLLKNIKINWIFKAVVLTISFAIIISMFYLNKKHFYPSIIIVILANLLIYLFERDNKKRTKLQINFMKNSTDEEINEKTLITYAKLIIIISLANIFNFTITIVFLVLFLITSIDYNAINSIVNNNVMVILIGIYIFALILLMIYIIFKCNKISKIK